MSHLKDALHIPDTQSGRDERHLPIQRVGIRNLRYPLQLRIGKRGAADGGAVGAGRGAAGREEGHAHVALRRLAGCAGRAAGRGHAARRQLAQCSTGCTRPRAASKPRFPFFLRKRAPVSGVESLLDYQGRWIAESARRQRRRVGRGRRAGEEPVPVLEGDLRLRRAQPALARDDPRRAAAADRMARTGALCRGQRVQRTLADAQARRREVGHRARLREPEVRRGPGARRGAAR